MKKVLIYDSGVGGRAVYQLLFKHWQNQIETGEIQLDYFGDTNNFPYGTKTEAELKVIVDHNLQEFVQQEYDLIGVACNTASQIIDKHFPQAQIITIIQPTIARIQELQPSSLFVIGTQFTIQNKIYSTLLSSKHFAMEVTEQAEQDLVSLVEEKKFPEIQTEIHRIISQIESGQTILLGCTHFSVVKELFSWEIEKQHKKVTIIDPSEELAKKVIGDL